MITEESTKAAVNAIIAKTILDGISPEIQQAMLVKSITNTMSDWKFGSAICEVVSARAKEIAAEMVATPEWTERITEAIKSGFDDYLASLRAAVPSVLMDVFHGKDGSYGHCGRILGKWTAKP